MLRFLITAVVSILAITFLRSVLGLIGKAMTDAMNPSATQQPEEKKAQVPAGGSLRKDPVCGTYVAEQAALRLTVRGEPVFFCSAACRDKYPVQQA